MHKLWLPFLVAASLGMGCERPAQEPAAPPAAPTTPPPAAAASQPASVVPIPEEFQETASPPAPTAPVAVTPRILFAVSDIQVTTKSGIQGIMAGETVNVIREVGDEIVVQYGDLEFIKPKSLFSAIFVGKAPKAPEPTPVAEPVPENTASAQTETPPAPAEQTPAAEPVDTIGLAAPVPTPQAPAAEPALPEEPAPSIAQHPPQLSPEEKKMAELTTSIRVLNDKIRVAQEQSSAQGKKPTRSEKRAIEQMKAERDELSQRLTGLGKP